MFSFRRELTTWHCPHSSAAAAAVAVRWPYSIDRYLLPQHPRRPGDVDPCAKDGFQVLRSPQAATFNSSFSASDYVPDTYCLVGTVEAKLRKCRLGRSSCLPVPASSVGDERGSTAHLRPASVRHSDHISDALISLHWLRAQERVRFKTAVLMELRRHS